MDRDYFIGLRVDKDTWEYLRRFKQNSKMSAIVRGMIHDHMERENPVKIIEQMIERLERGEIDPELFIDRFREIKQRYRQIESIYNFANEKIRELEDSGVLYQALGRLRLRDESMNKYL